MTQNEQYWIDRANRRMDGYQISAIKQAKIINKSYNQTCNYVQSEIAKILRHIGDEGTLAYEYRMKRLTALLESTNKRMQELYGVTLNDTTSFLRNIIPEAYYHTIFDIAQGIGEQPVFSAVNTRLINQIVNDQWSGKNYSQRIWWNTSKLSEDVQQLLTTAAMTGESIYKTSRRLSERFGESMNNSVRLIRTETTYSCNQAELASYSALDIDRYKFTATLDTRTSSICQELDGKVFETKDAKAGVNLPAMHPNCRSTTIAYFDEGMPDVRIAKDKDGNRIRVPADMTYKDWYKKYIENDAQSAQTSARGNNTPKPSGKPQRTPESAPATVDIPALTANEPEYKDTPIPQKINNQSIDNSVQNDIIESRNITSRNLPNGLRTAPSHILTDDEISALKKDIESIGADLNVFKFNVGRRTGYDDVLDEIRVKGDILPDLSSKHPRDRMSARAALAHEYYGHRANRGTDVPKGAWNDEFRASYMAAKNCPNLSDEERQDLVLDALERAKERGVTIKNNDFIRRTLYGY